MNKEAFADVSLSDVTNFFPAEAGWEVERNLFDFDGYKQKLTTLRPCTVQW